MAAVMSESLVFYTHLIFLKLIFLLTATLISIQQDLFSSQSASKLKGASQLPSKLPTSVSLFDDEDEEVNIVIATLYNLD